MVKTLIAYRPIKTNIITQVFGESAVCCKLDSNGNAIRPFVLGGVKKIEFVGGIKKAVCYPGWVDFYKALLLNGHNGIDLAAVLGEAGYHSWYIRNETGDVRPIEGYYRNENDSGKGLGVAFYSTEKVETPKGTHFIRGICWHIRKSFVTDNEKTSSEKVLFEANCTGACNGDHVHYAYQCLDDNGNVLYQDNGYRGWQDINKVFVNEFAPDILKVKEITKTAITLTDTVLKSPVSLKEKEPLLISLQRFLLLLSSRLRQMVGGDLSDLTHNTMADVQSYTSSTGSGDIGLRYKAMMLGIVPALAIFFSFIGSLLNIEPLKIITQNDLTKLIEAFFSVVSSLLLFWGLIRPYFPKKV